jgi:hypothetical protein
MKLLKKKSGVENIRKVLIVTTQKVLVKKHIVLEERKRND